jgi:gluconolactonase
MRRLVVLSLASAVIACSSSDPEVAPSPADDTGVVDAVVADSIADSIADSPTDNGTPDAPDLSTINPIEGAAAVSKIPGKTFSFTEGTTWNAAGYLLFSDIPNATIWKLTPPSTFTEFRPMSGKSNGLAFDPMGRLLACEHGNRRVSRTDASGTVTTLADEYMGKQLNSPNDVIVKSDGNVYFTDPDYGLEGRPAELAFKGIYRVDPSGALSLIDDSMKEPNGIAFSPDEKTLYVGDTGAPVTNKWSVGTDGALSGKTKFADTGSDGMCIDDAGNLYLPSGGIQVFKPSGDKWGTIAIPETPTNCAFGGADRKTLFVSAGTSIWSVTLKIPGKG